MPWGFASGDLLILLDKIPLYPQSKHICWFAPHSGRSVEICLHATYGDTYIRVSICIGATMITPPDVFKSLSDETRARATLLIASLGELCVCELMCALNDSQPKISRHLAQLRSNGMLLDRRQGQWVYYRLNPELPAWVHEMLQVTLQANSQWLADNSLRLQNMDGRPVRDAACC